MNPPLDNTPPEEWLDQHAERFMPRKPEPRLAEADAPLSLVMFNDIQPMLDAKDFVQGVLVEGSAAVVYGDSNTGKTFLATDLALHVGAGKTWNGRRVEQGGVVYCVLEGGIGFQNRVAAWRAKHAKAGKPVFFAAVQAPLNLLDADADTPRLISRIKDAAERLGVPVKLVVIDTLSRAMAGGNENAPNDMGALVRSMDQIRAETGACVLFVHHCGKDQARGARGHSLLRAAIDTELEVKANEETGQKTATVVKQRELAKGQIFGFTLEVVELGENRHGETVTTCLVQECEAAAMKPPGPRLTDDQKAALTVLSDLVLDRGGEGHPGVPPGVSSVPEAMWRDRFYDRCKAGALQDTKKRAFRRAADGLQKSRKVGLDNGHVWLA
jgi:RecA/RadA recombinase